MAAESHQDRGYAWIVLMASALSNFIFSSIYTVGVFNLTFLEVFRESKALTAWCPALMSSLHCLAGPLGGVIAKRFGCRAAVVAGGVMSWLGMTLSSVAPNFGLLFVTFGFITGSGIGIAYTPTVVILGYYFKKYLNIAVGIASSTAGVGMMTLPLLVQYLLDTYSWRGTMLLYGCVFLHLCVLGGLMRAPPVQDHITSEYCENISHSHDHESLGQQDALKVSGSTDNIHFTALETKDEIDHISNSSLVPSVHCGGNNSEGCQEQAKSNRRNLLRSIKRRTEETRDTPLYRNAKFICFCVSYFASSAGVSVVFMHLQAFAVTSGVEIHTSNFLITAIGVGGILGRFSSGFLSFYFKISSLLMYIVYLTITGLVTIFLPLYGHSLTGFLLFTAPFGFFGNPYQTFCGPITIDLVGIENLAMAYGAVMMISGIAQLICPPIAGWLFDTTLSYNYSFYVAGTCFLTSAGLAVLCGRLCRCLTSKNYVDKAKDTSATEPL